MDKLKQALAANLHSLAEKMASNRVRAIFAVALMDDGPTQTVLVDPEDVDHLIVAINEELTSMLKVPHHVVSTEKLGKFLSLHNITDQDLLRFKASNKD